jgi:hypothetical protein
MITKESWLYSLLAAPMRWHGSWPSFGFKKKFHIKIINLRVFTKTASFRKIRQIHQNLPESAEFRQDPPKLDKTRQLRVFPKSADPGPKVATGG